MVDPDINAGQYGHGRVYTSAWGDEFSGSGGPLFSRWEPDLMTEGLHKAGNSGVIGGSDNRRWAAFYDEPEATSFESDNSLYMRAVLRNEHDVGRKPFVRDGVTYNPQHNKIKLSFLTTWSREFSNSLGHHVTKSTSPNRTWGPGTAFEFKVDFSQMRTQCMRFSLYLLPAYENDSGSYSPDGTLGAENDSPEIDFKDGYENYAQAKVISSLAGGNTPAGSIDLDLKIPGIDLTTGEHTFVLIWQKDRFVWFCDGVEYQRDTDPRRIPQTAHYWVISREANSGVRKLEGTPEAGKTYADDSGQLPVDVGIWGDTVWAEEANIDGDTAKVIHFRSWSFQDTSTAGVGVGDDQSGISPTITSANPPTSYSEGDKVTLSWSANGRSVSDWYVRLGSSRGGNELGSAQTSSTSHEFTINRDYSGPVNARLWFREDSSSIWHWRDFGFSSGLQSYSIGTDGKISVTTNPPQPYSQPTVAGGGVVVEPPTEPPTEPPVEPPVIPNTNPRLVIVSQPSITEGRGSLDLVAEPRDGYDPDGKTLTWSSSNPALTFSPQGGLVTTPSLQNLNAEDLATITIDDGVP